MLDPRHFCEYSGPLIHQTLLEALGTLAAMAGVLFLCYKTNNLIFGDDRMAAKPNPEMLPGELLLANEHKDHLSQICMWSSRRVGEVARGRSGEVIPDHLPVFVSWDEVVGRGLDPNDFGPFRNKRQRIEEGV